MKHDNSHLTLDERKIIQTGIENRSTKVAIANTIGKDPTTVAKEIRKHRQLHPRNTANYPNICIYRKTCGNCFSKCERYKEQSCKRRDKSPGACNKCPDSPKCHLDKYFYYAEKANSEYVYDLHDSREGINLTTLERNELASILVPLVNQGQSIFYCDPMCSHQKPHVENNHNYIRDIIPNEVDISNITQEDINLMLDHINSTPRESLNGKTPYEIFEFLYGSSLLHKLGVNKIDRDNVILKPYLLKHIYKK